MPTTATCRVLVCLSAALNNGAGGRWWQRRPRPALQAPPVLISAEDRRGDTGFGPPAEWFPPAPRRAGRWPALRRAGLDTPNLYKSNELTSAPQ